MSMKLYEGIDDEWILIDKVILSNCGGIESGKEKK